MTQTHAAAVRAVQNPKARTEERERRNARWRVRAGQWGLLVAVFVFWWLMTKPGLVPPFFFENDSQAAFFFGEPDQIFLRIWEWFVGGEIYRHLFVTLYETLMAFVIGTVSGLFVGLWLARAPTAAAVLDPFIKGLNSMPRVILAPIFAVWFGLGPASKIALGVTLVFFIVFVWNMRPLHIECLIAFGKQKNLSVNKRVNIRYFFFTNYIIHVQIGFSQLFFKIF